MPSRLAGTQWQPSARQVADYRALIGSPRFTAEERERAVRWLEQSATVHTIPAQITWLREELTRRQGGELSGVLSAITSDAIRAAGEAAQ